MIVQPHLHRIGRTDLPICPQRPELEKLIGDGNELLVEYAPPDLVLHAVSRENTNILQALSLDRTRVDVLKRTDPERFGCFTRQGLLVDETAAIIGGVHPSIEIEINRHCNYRCVYCPVAKSPKPKGFMSDETYRLVLNRIIEYGAVMITLNHYSEPTLDPKLATRIADAVALGLSVNINTNGSMLNDAIIKRFASFGGVRCKVNIPSVDEAEYRFLTGSNQFDRVIRNLKTLHKYRMPTTLSINSPRDARADNVAAINDMFGDMFGESVRWSSDDRAGWLDTEAFGAKYVHTGRLNGCAVVRGQLNISHRGTLFLCCQDFDQAYVFGDLHTHSIEQIKATDAFKKAMAYILGLETPPDNFICKKCAWTENASPLTYGSKQKAPSRRELADILVKIPIRHMR
jgi:uncharacterized Fe-S cluster-containing radical SAM superfamily protein